MSDAPKPNADVARRVEELLREQLGEIGVNAARLEPHEIAAGMACNVGPDNSMTYFWRGEPLLRIVPEQSDGGVAWRMFTRDDNEQL